MLREDIPLRNAFALALPYPMEGLIARESPSSRTARAQSSAWMDTALEKTMALFHYVV